MDTVSAMIMISRLEERKDKHVPIEASLAAKAKIPVAHVTRSPTGEPMFCHVNRLDLIRYLKTHNKIIKKRQNLRDMICQTLS